MLSIKQFEEKDLPYALTLLKEEYLEASQDYTRFFAFDSTKKKLEDLLSELYQKNPYQYTIYEGDQMVGFLMGYVLPKLWGNYDGFYSPLHGHAIKKSYKKKGYQLLYQHLAKELVDTSILSHAITLYYEDDLSMNTWFHLGFGLRLIDSYKKIDRVGNLKDKTDLSIEQVNLNDLKKLAPLIKAFQEYFEESPLFMKRAQEDPLKDYATFLKQRNHYLYSLKSGREPVALMKLRPRGENYLTSDPKSIHICGLYVQESMQSKGLASGFLNLVEAEMSQLGYELLGVDFESFNIKGANFWHKHFQPYTYTLTRRIDEQILENK